jgi:TerC family integral membrane protein
VIEKALSVDNLFVFLLIFAYFKTPREYQHRALYVGILGALVFRGLFIASGLALIDLFSWVVYVFGGFLIFSGSRIAIERGFAVSPERNPLLKIARRYLPLTPEYEGRRLFIRRGKHLYATPLFIVILVIETTDILFAVDSIPAVLAVTRDPFIAYSSNIFAILGLRALYFALAGLQERFYLLRYGLAAILVFVGGKMLTQDFLTIPLPIALLTIGFLFFASTIASILRPQRPTNPAPP